MTAQLSVYDLLGPLGAKVVFHAYAEPGWAWYRCEACGEIQYRRRRKTQPRCLMTPHCRGDMVVHLEPRCPACGRIIERRLDPVYCSKRCSVRGSSA